MNAIETKTEHELVLASEAMKITGLSPEPFYKLVRCGTIQRFQPTEQVRARYYRSQLLELIKPPQPKR